MFISVVGVGSLGRALLRGLRLLRRVRPRRRVIAGAGVLPAGVGMIRLLVHRRPRLSPRLGGLRLGRGVVPGSCRALGIDRPRPAPAPSPLRPAAVHVLHEIEVHVIARVELLLAERGYSERSLAADAHHRHQTEQHQGRGDGQHRGSLKHAARLPLRGGMETAGGSGLDVVDRAVRARSQQGRVLHRLRAHRLALASRPLAALANGASDRVFALLCCNIHLGILCVPGRLA